MSVVVARSAGVMLLGLSLALPLHAQTSEEAPPAPAGDERRLDVFNYRIEGNNVLSRLEVEEAVLPYLGPQRPVSDVEKARLALIAAYRARGYETVDVQIPQQDVRSGVIRFEVLEYKVGRLRVKDSRYFSPEDIKAQVPSLAEGSVPNYKDVGQEIAALNKSADRMVTPTLRAGDTPGTVDVDLNVEDQRPLHGSIEINDRTSKRTKRARIAAGVSYNNLFQRGHSVNFQTQFTPEDIDQSLVLSASYVVPLRDSPITLVGYAVHSDSDVAATGDIDVLGKGNIVGLRAIYNKLTGEGENTWVHQITAGIDYKDFEERLTLEGNVDETPIDYVPLTLQYSATRRSAAHDFNAGVTLGVGLRGLAADDVEFNRKRYGARANWVTLGGNIGYTRTFGSDWRAGALLSGQYAGKPVISNEQFSAGGLNSVRGYYESQMLGDDGVSLQLQVDTPSVHAHAGDWLNEARFFAFADGASLKTYRPLQGQDANSDLASIGLGVTLRAFERVNASVLLAHPLIDRRNALAAYDTETLRDANGNPIKDSSGNNLTVERKVSGVADIGDHTRIQVRLWSEF